MDTADLTASFQTFFKSVIKYPSFALLTDYDGTLAPFQVNRELALPYPGIPELLLRLVIKGAHVAVVSGRPAHEMQRLLGLNSIELWGGHGSERLLPTGEYLRSECLSKQSTNFEILVEALEREQLASKLELKPSGVAVHWRGSPQAEVNEMRQAAIRAFHSMSLPEIEARDFDGGLEFRPRGVTKADAVRQIKRELPDCPMVYLGDDYTDEDAFRALDHNDLSVLVRSEYRPTSAQLWLRPPEELSALLDLMANSIGGTR
jgi:trehalose 6-phosphate phosphatase